MDVWNSDQTSLLRAYGLSSQRVALPICPFRNPILLQFPKTKTVTHTT